MILSYCYYYNYYFGKLIFFHYLFYVFISFILWNLFLFFSFLKCLFYFIKQKVEKVKTECKKNKNSKGRWLKTKVLKEKKILRAFWKIGKASGRSRGERKPRKGKEKENEEKKGNEEVEERIQI